MKTIHIISIGASIISNFKKVNGNIPDLSDDKVFEDFLKNKEFFNKIYQFVYANPYIASAELNSLKEFIESKKVNEVHCIVTDTNIGRLCFAVIEKYLRNKNISVSGKQPIPGYYKEKISDERLAEVEFINGLKKLKNNLIKFIMDRKNEVNTEIYINATGGFKPEIVILTLVGSITMTKVYYKHEFFGKNVFLPPLFLPYIKKKEAEALKYIGEKESNRIVTPYYNDFKSKYEDVLYNLLSFNLVKELKDENFNIYGIELTTYGKFVCDIAE